MLQAAWDLQVLQAQAPQAWLQAPQEQLQAPQRAWAWVLEEGQAQGKLQELLVQLQGQQWAWAWVLPVHWRCEPAEEALGRASWGSLQSWALACLAEAPISAKQVAGVEEDLGQEQELHLQLERPEQFLQSAQRALLA